MRVTIIHCWFVKGLLQHCKKTKTWFPLHVYYKTFIKHFENKKSAVNVAGSQRAPFCVFSNFLIIVCWILVQIGNSDKNHLIPKLYSSPEFILMLPWTECPSQWNTSENCCSYFFSFLKDKLTCRILHTFFILQWQPNLNGSCKLIYSLSTFFKVSRFY